MEQIEQGSDTLARSVDLLRQSGIRVVTADLDKMFLILPDHTRVSAQLHIATHSPGAERINADLSSTKGANLLYIVRKPGMALRTAAIAGRVEMIGTDPDRVIIGGEDRLPRRQKTPPHIPTARSPWGRWAVERALILSARPLTQLELAVISGVTQQSVSKIVRHNPAISKTATGWTLNSVEQSLDDWVSNYPGPGGLAANWYHLDPVTTQAQLVTNIADELEIPALQSGDIAAQEYAPWRLPTFGVAYSSESIDLSVVEFTPATSDESTFKLQIPIDKSIWPVANWYHAQKNDAVTTLADPILAMWDLVHSPGPDSSDAASSLRSAIVNGELRV